MRQGGLIDIDDMRTVMYLERILESIRRKRLRKSIQLANRIALESTKLSDVVLYLKK